MPVQKRIFKYLVLGIVSWVVVSLLALSISSWRGLSTSSVQAQPTPPDIVSPEGIPEEGGPGGRSGPGGPGLPEDSLQPFEELTAELEQQAGLFTIYSDLEQGEAYLALKPEQIGRNFLIMASIESGIGEAGLFRGWPVNDLLIQFREAADNQIQVVVPNTFIRNPEGQNWQQRLLESSFSDSIIFATKVVSIDPDSEAKLIDLSDLIMDRDLLNLTASLGPAIESYQRSKELSSFDSVKAFDNNVEIATTTSFSNSGGDGGFSLASLFGFSIEGLPDSRGFSLGIRYSLSGIPENNGYEARQADERVGYFVSAYRAPLQVGQSDPFVRLIHRWKLTKQTPGTALSEPVEPIVFWVENTVPPEYRASIEKGILLWNEGFEQAGFQNAIEARQMPDNAEWDPSDVRYNVVRWSDSLGSSVSGLGPSRVNPLTGEILDADIILDANVVQTVLQQYRTRGLEGTSPEGTDYLQLCGQPAQDWYVQWLAMQRWGANGPAMARSFAEEMDRFSPTDSDSCADYLGTQQASFGALALAETSQLTRSQLDTYLQQYLVMLTAHEVGHTLGLRHNFAGSNALAPEQLNDTGVTQIQGLVSSIMDYVPPNIAPPGVEQGDFFPTRLGAYDKWAIEYGYQEVVATGLQQGEAVMLDEIADRSEAPELAFAADEDIYDFIDPEVSAWDLSSNPLQFATWQMENAQSVWQQLNRLSVRRNEGFGGLRRRVDMVFRYFDNNTATLTNYIGGQSFRRVSPWESERAPFEPIPVEKQREALAALNEKVFAADAFQFSPRLLNQLAPDRWSHVGTRLTIAPLDYPIFEQVLAVQSFALSNLLSATRLGRVRDLEYKSDQADVMTIAEVFDSAYQGIWTEVANPDEAVSQNLSSLRRGLQRHHLNILSNLVLRKSGSALAESQSFLDFVGLAVTLGAPDDARVLARYQLGQIYDDVNRGLRRNRGMDITTKAHWEEVRDRIDRILNAPLTGS